MTCKIAICDDSRPDTDYIKKLTLEWAESRKITLSVDTFPSAESFLFNYAERKDYDILLLDIEMKAISGVELAQTVRRENDSVQIIFITGYSDYISEGYEVSALHYLMKPVSGAKLFEVLDRAAARLQKNERVIYLEISGEMARIPLHKIKYIDVQKNYVTVHADKSYTVKKTLGEAEKELDDRFFKIGRSCVVNLSFITRVTKTDVTLSSGEVLPLPRGMYEPLNRAIISRT